MSCTTLTLALERTERVPRRFTLERNLPFWLQPRGRRPYQVWEQDWHIPQQYGIHQVDGENGGPGGLFHSLRIVPPILSICVDMFNPIRMVLAITRNFLQ